MAHSFPQVISIVEEKEWTVGPRKDQVCNFIHRPKGQVNDLYVRTVHWPDKGK
jgi:hypothetical protein